MFALVNGKKMYCLDSATWLMTLPRGAYTTARVLNGRILEFNAHMQRLKESLEAMNLSYNVETIAMDLAKHCIGDCRITWYFGPYPAAHYSSIPPLPKCVKTKVSFTLKRTDPQIKDTEFVKQRSSHLDKEFNEVLISDGEHILEGCSSNFVAIVDNVLYTAPDDLVLKGTILKVALECAVEANIKVIRSAPKLERIDAAFLTSTTRLCLFISSIEFKDKIIVLDTNHPIVLTIQNMLMKKLIENSIEIKESTL